MAEPDKRPVTFEELLLAQTDALGKTLDWADYPRREFMQKISEERATYQRMLHKVK